MAYTVTYFVASATTGLPIAGASVSLTHLNGYIELTTDAAGMVTYTGVGLKVIQNPLKITAPGFKSDIVALNNGATAFLQPGSGWAWGTSSFTSTLTLQLYTFDGANGVVGGAQGNWDADVTLTGLVSGQVVTASIRNLPGSAGTKSIPGVKNEPFSVTAVIYRGAFPGVSPPDQTYYGYTYNLGGSDVPQLAFTFNAAGIPPPPPPPDDDSGNAWPSITHTRRGLYLMAHTLDGVLQSSRAPFSTPPFDLALSVGNAARRPSNAIGLQSEAQFVAYQVDGPPRRVKLIRSDDDGKTWNPEEDLMSGASPRIASNRRGYQLLVAYQETDSGAHTGELHGLYRDSEDAPWGDEFTLVDQDGTPLPGTASGFDISDAPSSDLSWLLALAGSGAIKHYESTDEGRTWLEVT